MQATILKRRGGRLIDCALALVRVKFIAACLRARLRIAKRFAAVRERRAWERRDSSKFERIARIHANMFPYV